MEKRFVTFTENVATFRLNTTESLKSLVVRRPAGLHAVKETTVESLAAEPEVEYNDFKLSEFVKGLRERNYTGPLLIGTEYSIVAYIPHNPELYSQLATLGADEYSSEVSDDGNEYIRLWWD